MKRKRTLVPQQKIDMPRVEPIAQMKLTDYFFAMSSPIRLAIMRFLDRAKGGGFGMQTFTGIQKALEGSYHVIAANTLNHHLAELKKVGFVEHVPSENGNAGGYLLLDLGHQLLAMCKNMEEHVDRIGFRPNALDNYVYRENIDALLVPVKNEPHIVEISPNFDEYAFSPARQATNPVNPAKNKHSKEERDQNSFSRLESFA